MDILINDKIGMSVKNVNSRAMSSTRIPCYSLDIYKALPVNYASRFELILHHSQMADSKHLRRENQFFTALSISGLVALISIHQELLSVRFHLFSSVTVLRGNGGACPHPTYRQDYFLNSFKFGKKMLGLGLDTCSKILKWV